MQLLMAVDKYNLGNYPKEICIKHLKSNLTIENAVEVLAKSYHIGCKDLLAVAFNFMKQNQGKIVPHEKYHDIFQQALCSIFLDSKARPKYPKPMCRTIQSVKKFP